MTPLVYALDDEASIREVYAQALGYGGYRHKEFATWNDLSGALKEEIPDLLLLDLMLGPVDGLEVLEHLKKDPLTASVPVIIVSAKGEENDKVKGLELGADDYLSKPFGILELLARVKARLRNAPKRNSDNLDLILNEDEHLFYCQGVPLELTLKEFEVLRLLYLNRGKVIEKDAILVSVWDMPQGVETRTLDVHISSLRKKLARSSLNIKTIRGVGFILS